MLGLSRNRPVEFSVNLRSILAIFTSFSPEKINIEMSRKPRFGLFYLVRRSVILTLPLILFASILAGVTMLPTAHALTGVVCLTDSSAVVPGPNPCPATPYIFNGPFHRVLNRVQLRFGLVSTSKALMV